MWVCNGYVIIYYFLSLRLCWLQYLIKIVNVLIYFIGFNNVWLGRNTYKQDEINNIPHVEWYLYYNSVDVKKTCDYQMLLYNAKTFNIMRMFLFCFVHGIHLSNTR